MNKFTHQIAEVYENIEELGSKYIYVDDSLVYWQDNTVPVSEHSEELPVLAELSNGVYLHKSVKDKESSSIKLPPFYILNFTIVNMLLRNKQKD